MLSYRKFHTLFLLVILPLASFGLERTDLLPAEAQTHFRLSNTTNFWSKLKQSSLGKLWIDQQFQDFIGNPDAETWQELFFEGQSAAEDNVFLEQLKMLSGEIIFAFDAENDSPHIIAAMSKEDFLRSLELDDQLKGIMENPFEIIKSTFQDVEIIQHIEHAGTPKEERSWQTHVDETFVLGHTREWVEECIVKLKKESIKEPKGNPHLNIKLPLSILIREGILKDMEKEAAQTPGMNLYEPEALLKAMGLLGIEHFSVQVELKDSEMVIDNTLRVSDLDTGIFTILDTQPSEFPTVAFIPENIASLEIGRFNLLRFWQEIPNVLATAMPAVKPQFDLIVAMLQQQAGINLEQDLLANIGTKYFSYATAEAGTQTSVMAVELKDAEAFKTGLETALSAPALQPQIAASLEIEEFRDQSIYTIQNPDPNATMAFTVSGDHLLYGQPEGIRQVIRSESSDTAAKQDFERTELVKGLREHVPSRAFAYSAIDWKKNMDAIVRELGKPEYTGLIQQNWAKSGSPLPPPDFSKLPPADHIAGFFNVSYQYAEADANGLHQRIYLKY
jgi:hypothetical protein